MNIRRLKPIELMRLLNSQAGRTVLTETRLRRDREKCAYLIGDGATIDLLKYVGWLLTAPDALPAAKKEPGDGSYEQTKLSARERAEEKVRAAQDVGEIPPPKNPDRRAKASASFQVFCETYFKRTFDKPWSPIHLKVIEKIERVVVNGDIYALAMPRGSGKTTLNTIAIIWACITGKNKYAALIASSSDRAQQLLDHIKTWLETNVLLCEDFPEVCIPIRKLERVANRQKGQRYRGVPTRIEWGAKNVVFPTIEGSAASGARIQCAGMNGSEIRGLGFVNSEGEMVRPSLALVDDPQTRESAQSKMQCDDRERIVLADILGMAGPDGKFACLIAMTVIATDDLAERLLDRRRHPDFRGERYKLLESLPTNAELWEEYRNIRDAELQNDGDGSEATEFYRSHREEMDAGAVSTWPERFDKQREISGIQFAMNLKFRNEDAFQSEYQNEPIVLAEGDEMLTADEIRSKTNGYRRGVAPIESQILTGFIDVHKDLLYWVAVAWERNFTGFVIDYGTYPKQKRTNFQLSEARPTLGELYPNAGLEGCVFQGVKDLLERLFTDGIQREDDLKMSFDRILVDANWGTTTDVVYQACRTSPFSASILPSHGVFVGASSKPFAERKRQRGDWFGPHWLVPNVVGKRAARHALIDTNYWKSFVHSRLATAQGDAGSLTFNGPESEHQLIAAHLTAEYCVPTSVEKAGRRVDEWKMRMKRPDNHWFDCLVGACVAASMSGADLPSLKKAGAAPTVERITFAEAKRRRLGQ